MTMLPDYATLEEFIRIELVKIPGLVHLELEPIKGSDTADLQTRMLPATAKIPAITFSFATTGRVNRLTRAGLLAIHFYAPDPKDALKEAYTSELEIEDALSGSEGVHFTIAGCTFDTRLPLIDEDTREFINVECTYNIQYTIRR